jgi:hypothetical protein
MLEFLKYKKRLAAIRFELVEIEENLSTLPDETKGLREVADSLGKVCRILIRVIDSLPG